MIHRFIRHRFDPRGEVIWLTIYADMITNLMLVFLAMYGLTVMGTDAMELALKSMKDGRRPVAIPFAQFDQLAPALEDTVGSIPGIDIISEVGAIRLQFGENVLFNSGSASLKPSARDPLISVGALLRVLPHTIVVEGHTDTVPVSRASGFKNNHELSLARSMAVVRLLIGKGGVPAAQVAAAAYGEYRPRSPNTSSMGRRLNRRVEIAIFRDFPYADRATGSGPKP